MLNSTVLEVAIGLVFCYASMALIASSLYEAIASLFKLRAKTLLAGVKSLLNDKAFTGLALDVYNHALVNPREVGKTDAREPPSVKPSYIEPRSFAIALIDSVQGAPAVFGELKAKIDALPDAQMKTLLQGMYARADGSLANLETSLASWFDDGMNRVSGGYKRQAQLFTFLITLGLAGLFNVDTFHLFQSLWEHPTLAAQITATPTPGAAAALEHLRSLPVGWNGGGFTRVGLLGWLVTAAAALFGAPFWFDLLQRMVNLRGTGTKPDEKDKEKDKRP